MNGKLEIEVITPLFIGNGEQYSPVEYIYEENFFTPVNVEKLIETKYREGKTDFYLKILEGLEKGNIDLKSLCKEYRIDYREFARYRLGSTTLSVHDKVLQYIKSGGKVFIPGSSIKGALRSVLTNHIINSKAKLSYFTETIDKVYKNIVSNTKSKEKSNNVDNEADEKIFGGTYDSPFRFISVSDSNLREPDVLNVYQVKILNICNGKVKWFQKKDINVEQPEKARSVFLEGIKEKSLFSCYVTINEVSHYIANEAKIKNIEIANKFAFKINSEVENYINNEISFFNTYGQAVKNITDFYYELLRMIKSLDKNEFMLQVGFGTGMLSKTILLHLDDKMKSKVAKISRHKYYGSIYPKTRKIVFENGQPKYVPGWIKCKLVCN